MKLASSAKAKSLRICFRPPQRQGAHGGDAAGKGHQAKNKLTAAATDSRAMAAPVDWQKMITDTVHAAIANTRPQTPGMLSQISDTILASPSGSFDSQAYAGAALSATNVISSRYTQPNHAGLDCQVRPVVFGPSPTFTTVPREHLSQPDMGPQTT